MTMHTTQTAMPTIRLGKVTVSRLILGSNPFFGFAHRGGDVLVEAMKAYYTDDRIMAVMEEAAGLGMTAVAAPPYQRWIDLWARYRAGGGRLATWIAQPDPEPRRMRKAIAAAGRGGAAAAFVQGARADDQFDRRHFDVLTGWLELIRSFGIPAGLASHWSRTHAEYERRALPADFFFQCFYNPGGNQNYDPTDRDANANAAAGIARPVIGYKILAAGRLTAREGFEFAFRHLRAKDGVCVGFYPPENPAMLAEAAELTVELSARQAS
jgi:hypothetical protein